MTKNEFIQLLGKHLNQIRKQHGLSVNELAQKSTVSKCTIYGIENGKINPRLSTIKKFSIAMEHPISDFFDFEF